MMPDINLGYIVTLVGGIVLAILANLLTPYAQDLLGHTSLRLARCRLKQLEVELALVAHYVEKPTDLILRVQLMQLYIISMLFVGILFIVLPFPQDISLPLMRALTVQQIDTLIKWFGTLAFILGIYWVGQTRNLVWKVRLYSKYKEKTEEKIAELRKRIDKLDPPPQRSPIVG